MLRNRLFDFPLAITLVVAVVRATTVVDERSNLSRLATEPAFGESRDPIWMRQDEYLAGEGKREGESSLRERTPHANQEPEKRASPVLSVPRATPPPQKRQDNGQIVALSQQLQSATQAISSVSSSASSAISFVSQSAQSAQQSADQAVRSANQNADQLNQALSRTQSSAASAMASLSASASSQLSANMLAAQSSASNAISAVQASASESASSAMNVAFSQVQAARADATAARGDANNLVTQIQQNSISSSNFAILLVVAVVGTMIINSLAAWWLVSYRRKRRHARQSNETMAIEKPMSTRDSVDSPRLTPSRGGKDHPMNKLELPDLGPSASKPRKPSLKTRVTTTPREGNAKSGKDAKSNKDAKSSSDDDGDVYGVGPTSFRLEADPEIKSAASVRLIRVGSSKGLKEDEENGKERRPGDTATAPVPLPSTAETKTEGRPSSRQKPKDSPKKRSQSKSGDESGEPSRAKLTRKAVPVSIPREEVDAAETQPGEAPRQQPQPAKQPESQSSTRPKEQPKEQSQGKPSREPEKASESNPSTQPRKSQPRVLPWEPEPPPNASNPHPDSRPTTRSSLDTAEPSKGEPFYAWRPPSRNAPPSRSLSQEDHRVPASQRLRFRDSGDSASDPASPSEWGRPIRLVSSRGSAMVGAATGSNGSEPHLATVPALTPPFTTIPPRRDNSRGMVRANTTTGSADGGVPGGRFRTPRSTSTAFLSLLPSTHYEPPAAAAAAAASLSRPAASTANRPRPESSTPANARPRTDAGVGLGLSVDMRAEGAAAGARATVSEQAGSGEGGSGRERATDGAWRRMTNNWPFGSSAH